jgi:DNA-binding beta-propeller fold protein YncE
MCCVANKSLRAIVAAVCLLQVQAIVGCARPKGILFPPLDPPRVWPAPPDQPRIKLLGTIADSGDLKASKSGYEAFKTALRGGRPSIKFSGPHAVAVQGPNMLAVADSAGRAVHIINLDDRTHTVITGFADQQFAIPLGVTWVGERLFVTDAQRHEVIELNALGEYHNRFGGDVLTRPVGIVYVPERKQLYVVDGGSHTLKVFALSGELVKTVGQRGTAPGELNFPTHISCSGNRLLVADTGNFRVQLMDLDGASLKTIGQKGDGAGDFSLPKGVGFDRDGHVYVVDAQFENVQIFDDTGRLLMAFGEEGGEAGEFWLPAGIAIDAQDRIWVADSGNHRLQVFAYMGTSP